MFWPAGIWSLLELMRNNAEEMREAIVNTPSAQDLRKLFERNP